VKIDHLFEVYGTRSQEKTKREKLDDWAEGVKEDFELLLIQASKLSGEEYEVTDRNGPVHRGVELLPKDEDSKNPILTVHHARNARAPNGFNIRFLSDKVTWIQKKFLTIREASDFFKSRLSDKLSYTNWVDGLAAPFYDYMKEANALTGNSDYTVTKLNGNHPEVILEAVKNDFLPRIYMTIDTPPAVRVVYSITFWTSATRKFTDLDKAFAFVKKQIPIGLKFDAQSAEKYKEEE
jgi:hypothetical protein